jgi:hypothetical protein
MRRPFITAKEDVVSAMRDCEKCSNVDEKNNPPKSLNADKVLRLPSDMELIRPAQTKLSSFPASEVVF